MSYISLQNAISYLDTVREFIIEKDIPVTIRGNANYLAALGLSTYTEVLQTSSLCYSINYLFDSSTN